MFTRQVRHICSARSGIPLCECHPSAAVLPTQSHRCQAGVIRALHVVLDSLATLAVGPLQQHAVCIVLFPGDKWSIVQ